MTSIGPILSPGQCPGCYRKNGRHRIGCVVAKATKGGPLPARISNLKICPACLGAGLHKLGCPDYTQIVMVPTVLARAFTRKRVKGIAWRGFQDAMQGVQP